MDRGSIVTWVVESFQLGDRRRSKALGEMAWGLIKAGTVSFAAIGRALAGASTAASCITRVFKFCHNSLIDVPVVQWALIQALVGKALTTLGGIPNLAVVAVDWHAYDNGDISGLRISLMTGTRALPLLWYEVRSNELGGRKSQIEQQAIRDLIRCRPPGVTWLILLDAGFRSPDLIRLLDQAGYYVVRSGAGTLVHSGSSCWKRIGDLPVEVGQLVELGWVHWSQQNPLIVRLVIGRLYDIKPPKPGRRHRPSGRYKYTKPGLCAVVTNLPMELFSALTVIRLYARRFEIEHSFRDIKNSSLGMDMEHVHLLDTNTYSRLMCIVAVAEALLWLAGSEAEARRLHLELTPSRPRNGRRVLSLRSVGRLCVDQIAPPIGHLIREHLGRAIRGILNVVGRTWRDARDERTLRALVRSAKDILELNGDCNRKGKGRRRPCRLENAWPTLPVLESQAA